MSHGQRAKGQCLTETHGIPDADWREYALWLCRARRRFVVREHSMVPTLMPGDTILAAMGASVQVGDVAIFRWRDVSKTRLRPSSSSDLLLIKRVSEIFYDGGVYVISDNVHEPNARDSRHFGAVNANQILGRVTSRLASSL